MRKLSFREVRRLTQGHTGLNEPKIYDFFNSRKFWGECTWPLGKICVNTQRGSTVKEPQKEYLGSRPGSRCSSINHWE